MKKTDKLDLTKKKKKRPVGPVREAPVRSFSEKLEERISRAENPAPPEEKFLARPEEEAEEAVKAEKRNPPPVDFERKTLANGLKMITAPLSGTKTVTILLMFGTGSKYESLAQNGLSHFLEHMFFKGTRRRPNARKLSSELDALGCEYNAFTGKEYTGYWIKIDSSKAGEAMDVLSDMLLHSKFSAAEIDKERGVIIEEINMYHENPMMHIEDVFETCLYGDTPAGREIAGPKSNIRSFKRQDFLNYFNYQYGANEAVLCLAGDINAKTVRLAEKYFGLMNRSAFREKLRTPDAQSMPAVRLNFKEGNQAVISLGVRAFDTYHQDKTILKVLTVILGGSMSSRLFTEVREKRGLAYAIHARSEFFTDTGYLTTDAGIPVGKQDKAIEVILGEYKRIKKTLVPSEELRRAKDLIKGRTIIGFEQSDHVANWYATQAVLKQKISRPEDFFAEVEAVTPEDIRRVAREIFLNKKLNLAVIGPFKEFGEFERILEI